LRIINANLKTHYRRTEADEQPGPRGRKKRKKTAHKSKSGRRAKRRRAASPESSQQSSSEESHSSEDSSQRSDKRRKKKRRQRRSRSSSSSSSSTSGSDSDSSGDDTSHLTKKQIAAGKIVWKILAKAWPFDQRPRSLQKKKNVYTQTLDAILKTKEQLDKIESKENLGEEAFSKDGKPEKVRYKAQTDNGIDKLHPARGNRLPIDHPKHWFKKLVPKRRETVIRNFPMDHLGLTGKISEATLGKMHNRSVKLTLDMFCKSSNREARGPHRAGKYPSHNQLVDGVNAYGLALHAIWPLDYTGWVLHNVLNEADWAQKASQDDKKRAELVTELFNSVMSDNCGKAVHGQYPAVYEQVTMI
jgi:hypothetical protein